MKKKAIIIIILTIIVFVGIRFFKSRGSELIVEDEEYDDSYVEDEEINEIYIYGQITSFNTEVLDTTLWTKIDKVLPENESIVSNGQEILNVSNESATGKIYATIDGKFIEDTDSIRKSYKIYDLNNLGFEAQVSEEKVNDLKIGQKVDVVIQASNEHVEGRVCYISNLPQNENIKIRVKLINNDKIKIGYTVNATILLDEEIDSNIPVYDIKNSIPKIGKTTVKYKFSNEEAQFSTPEEMISDEDLMKMLEELLAERGIEFPILDNDENSNDEFFGELSNNNEEDFEEEISSQESDETNNESQEVDLEQISDYFNAYWSEYWSEYWRAYYLRGEE